MNPPAANNQYWLLNSVNGWRVAAPPNEPFYNADGSLLFLGADRNDVSVTHGLLQNTDGSITLPTLPGEATKFTPDLTGQVLCPAALACDDCGRIWVLDAAASRVVRIDPSGAIQTVADFGGAGSRPRQFNAPRGLALARDRVVVCDTSNHRVQVFSPSPYALLQLWGRADGTPGDGPLEFRWPWGVAADAGGNVYVADRGNARVQQIALDGTLLATLGAGVLKDPTEVAVSPLGTLAVVDGAALSGGGSVQLFTPVSAAPRTMVCDGNVVIAPGAQSFSPVAAPTALTVDRPRAAAFDADSNLYVGTVAGLVYHFAPDLNSPGGYSLVGVGATGLSSSAVGLISVARKGLLGILQDADGPARRLWWVPTDSAFASPGVFVTASIDSGIEECPWDRVTLLGSIPDGASVKVEYFTSDAKDGPLAAAANDGPPYTFSGDSSSLTCNDPSCGDPTCQDPKCGGVADQAMTCLVQAQPGQFLRLRLTLTSGGQSTPRISAINVFFPRQSYLQHLPAVYQEDPVSRDFLDRFLSLFQATFDAFDATIDSMWRLFDADSTPPQYFDWLAAWLQLPTDPTWTLATKRMMLKKAAVDYRKRGTAAGITQAVKDYAGVGDGVALVEHFRLRNWPLLPAAAGLGETGQPSATAGDPVPRCGPPGAPVGGAARLWSRQFYRRLQVGTFSQVGAFVLTDRPEPAAEANDWGANEFSVFYPADPYCPAATTAKVRAVVEREKPAHTKANLVPVLPRFRVGVQATLGVDTRVGGYTQMVLGSLSTLGYDAILARSPTQRDLEQLGATVLPVTGVTTRLF